MSELLPPDGQLDLISEPPPLGNQAPAIRGASPVTARVVFRCCRVYAQVNIPPAVLDGRLSSWRFHCPRCGQLSEIPL